MKIALINPPFLFPVQQEIILSHCLGLRYISSYLRLRGGHDVYIIDALAQGFSNVQRYADGFVVGMSIDEIVKSISSDTTLIGLSVPFSQLAPIVHDLIGEIKTHSPGVIVIMGGVYPSTQPELALQSRADFIVIGEGEAAMLQIADGGNPKEIKGVYACGKQYESFAATELLGDLDQLPFPDDTLPYMNRYFDISPRNDRAHRTASLITSRGCPFHCEFCSIHPVYGHKWRARSAPNVLAEIEYLHEQHGINAFEIEDDNFTVDKARTIEILEGIIKLNEKGCGLSWRTPNGVRIDTIDQNIARLIKKSNCREIVVALEHGDSAMLASMQKGLSLDKAYDVIRILAQEGIEHITLFVIAGYPGETQARFSNSIEYLKRIKSLGENISVWVNIAQPYPGTQLLARCRKEGYLAPNYTDNFLTRRDLMSTGYSVHITTPDFDTAEVLRRKAIVEAIFAPQPLKEGGHMEGAGLNASTSGRQTGPIQRDHAGVRILLLGWYYQGNRGDDLSIEPISRVLRRHGDVKVSTTVGFDADLIDWCDLLVIGSGSHITPRGISCYEHVKYAKEKGKKIFFYSQTIEGGHPQFLEHVARADLITVRDSESKETIETHGFRAILAVDPIFEKRRRKIGCSFRRWVNEPSNIEEALASVLDNLAADYEILFLPFTEADTDTQSDKTFHEKIMARMKQKTEQVSYDDAIDAIDLLVGMRLHALVGAVNKGKQVLAIDYDTKIRRIFSDLAMEDRVVSYDRLTKIPVIIRKKIFPSDQFALRDGVNDALLGKICADLKGEPCARVSVVMPTYNRAEYLKEAIDSLLNQTMSDWKLILIDDGSTDTTKELVDSYGESRIRYYNFGHNGISFSRNMGSALSRGDIIVVADSDDVNLPDRLQRICAEMGNSPWDIVYSSMFHFSDKEEREFIPSQPFSLQRLREGNFIYHPTVAYRRAVAMACPYDESLEMVEDYHMYLQAADKGFKFHQIEEPLVLHRLHQEQISVARGEEMTQIHKKLVDTAGTRKRTVDDPLVSIIIPTYNRPSSLEKALASVLAQAYGPIEIIVVNDGGTDIEGVIDTLNVQGRITSIRHEHNKGLPAARNTGLRVATGKYVAYLDDDDIYYPNHLGVLVDFLEQNHCVAAYTDSYHVFQEWITDRYVTVGKMVVYSQSYDPQKLLVHNYIPVLNMIHRRDVLESAGFFDETLDAHEDWDMWIRLSQYGGFHHISIPTAEVTVRSDATTLSSHSKEPFLRTLRLIHKRYAHLITLPSIPQEQKQFEAELSRQAGLEITDSIARQYEHFHRYRFAADLVQGKSVLILGCGEGDGGFVLSQNASSVLGVDMAERSISRARSRYIKPNLEFKKGSITDNSISHERLFDVVVSLEESGYVQEYDKLLTEVKRLLKPDGIFITSTLNKPVSSEGSNCGNPLNWGGFYFDEFRDLLSKNFRHVFLYGQKLYPSSNIFPIREGTPVPRVFSIEKGDEGYRFLLAGQKTARHLVAIASNGTLKNSELLEESFLLDISETLFRQRSAHIDILEHMVRDREANIATLNGFLRDRENKIESLRALLTEKDGELIRQRDDSLSELHRVVSEKETVLNNIYNSHGWKALLACYRIRDRILPANSKRRAWVKSVFRGLSKR